MGIYYKWNINCKRFTS